MPTVKLKRASEFANWLRAYHVILDGQRVARIRSGSEVQFEAPHGHHTVELTVDWCRSNPLHLDLHGDANISLRCGCNHTGWGLFRIGRVLTDPAHYLWIHPATPHEQENSTRRENR